MFQITSTVTFNGKKMTDSQISKSVDNMAITFFVNKVKARISENLTFEEASSISLEFNADNLDDLSFSVVGPEHLVVKVLSLFSSDND